MSKSPDEQATEITIAWLHAWGPTKSVPKPEIVKGFWELMFKTINNSHKLVE